MKDSSVIKKDLIAPCGMNCAICSKYLAYVHRLSKPQCPGCRPGNQPCDYLFKKCLGINRSLQGNSTAHFCSACDLYPCKEIDRMDKRYRKNYQMSVKQNLTSIEEEGMAKFIETQYRTYRCHQCGGVISVHNKKCFACDKISKLVEK